MFSQIDEKDKKTQESQDNEARRKRLKQFIDTMCHELRNPLNGIYGNVTLLQDTINSLQKLIESAQAEQINSALRQQTLALIEQGKESVTTIHMCAQYQKAVIDDVLSLSKLEAGKVELNIVAFDPKTVINDVVAMLNVDIKRKELELYLKLIHKNITVNGDPHLLKKILLNLLMNAIKFTPHGGKITISLKSPVVTEDHTLLSFVVKDTGIGMTEEEKPRVFERFFQAGSTINQEYSGSGLGLVISRNLIKLMGGDINVESQAGKGTKFTFTIQCPHVVSLQKAPSSPLSIFTTLDKKEEEPKKEKAISVSEVASPTSRRILIVEDSVVNQKILKRFLEREGHYCEIANHGQEALNVLKTKSFDLIFMDVLMPVMDGLEATRTIRRLEQQHKKSSVPIIGLSGNADQEQIKEAKKSGMDDYLTKPYDDKTLLEKIALWCSSSALMQQESSVPEISQGKMR